MLLSRPVQAALCLTAALVGLPAAHAMDTSSFTSPKATAQPRASDGLKAGRDAIARRDFKAAVEALEGFTKAQPDNADGFNLLGYSLRNLQRYEESLAAYDRALAINPDHRGALEYKGIAFVQMGRLDEARGHLARLDRLCTLPCEEYRSLKKAIETGSSGSY